MSEMKLYGRPGWGSAIIETQLVWYGLPFEFHEVGDLFADATARRELERVNPAGQIPALELEDGTLMTESAAITLWLAERTGSADLVPPPGDAERARFLRWLAFLVGNVYPTYTYADVPARFVAGEIAQDAFAARMDAHAKKLYLILDAQASAPWFLGERFSAIDIYACTMTHWRPYGPWFEEAAGKLFAIRERAKGLERLAGVWTRNFPEKGAG